MFWLVLMIYWRTEVQLTSLFTAFAYLFILKSNWFHPNVGLYFKRPQKTSQCGKNISASCGPFLSKPLFDVIFDHHWTDPWKLGICLFWNLMNICVVVCWQQWSHTTGFELYCMICKRMNCRWYRNDSLLNLLSLFSKASRCYQKAFDLDPSSVVAGIALGDSLMEVGNEVNEMVQSANKLFLNG